MLKVSLAALALTAGVNAAGHHWVDTAARIANTPTAVPRAWSQVDRRSRTGVRGLPHRLGATTTVVVGTSLLGLATLLGAAGRTLTHQQIFDAVWGRQFGSPQQYLRVHITNLRRKVEIDPANNKALEGLYDYCNVVIAEIRSSAATSTQWNADCGGTAA